MSLHSKQKSTRRIVLSVLFFCIYVLSTCDIYSAGITVDNSTKLTVNGSTINIDDDLNISGIVAVPTGTITVGGNWTDTGEFFDAGSGTVSFNGVGNQQTITGTSTFFNLSKITKSGDNAGSLLIDINSKQTITNSLELKGLNGNELSLHSSSSGSQFALVLLDGGMQSLEFLNVKDANASGGQRLRPLNSSDSGNNTNWFNPSSSESNPKSTPTLAPGATQTPTPVATLTPVATPTPMSTPTPVATPTATVTPQSSPTLQPTNTPVIIDTGIKGRVLDEGNTPLEDIFVDAFNEDSPGESRNGTVTDLNGEYLIVLAPGMYKVSVDTSGTNLIGKFFEDAFTFADAVVIEVLPGEITENINFILKPGVVVKGKLSGPGGFLISDAILKVVNTESEGSIKYANTDDNGNFEIVLAPGVYDIFVDILGSTVLLQANLDLSSISPDDAPIEFGVPVQKVFGEITDDGGKPLDEMFVNVFDSQTERLINFGKSNINGEYTIFLLPGNYNVSLDVVGSNFKESSKNVVVDNVDVELNFNLSHRSFIRGIVKDTSDVPVTGMVVDAFEFESGFWGGSDVTNAEGKYSISVQEGEWKVGVDTADTDFVPVFFENSDWQNAVPVVVMEDTDTLDVDLTIGQTSLITGSVKNGSVGLGGILINIFDFNSGTWINLAETDNIGNYEVAVFDGVYLVEADGTEQGFSKEFFSGNNESTGAPVTVDVGESVSEINIELDSGGSISGTVKSDGKLLSGTNIDIFDFDNNRWISSATTVNGIYTAEMVPTGKYRVRASDPAGNFVMQFFNESTSASLANTVFAENGQDMSNVDFDLLAGIPISGLVVDTDTSEPINAITIEVYDANTGQSIGSVDTNNSGEYSITVFSGEYKVRAVDISGRFASQYYSGRKSWNSAKLVTVDSGEVPSNIDFNLLSGSSISGMVKDSNNRPLKNIKISIFDFETDGWINSGVTDLNGRYKVSVLPGKYRAVAGQNNPDFSAVVFNNKNGWDKASPITIIDTQSVKDINFTLEVTVARITGKIKDSNESGIGNIGIQVFDYDSALQVADTLSDKDGSFTLPVPPGRYRLFILPLSGQNRIGSEFYNNVKNWNEANVVEAILNEEIKLNDIILEEGFSLKGVVRDTSGKPMPDIRVNIYGFDSGVWSGSAYTDNEGTFSINGLSAGVYRINIIPLQESGLATTYYNGRFNWDSADRITIGSEEGNNIDVEFLEGGFVAGRIIDNDNEMPIPGINVEIYDFESGAWLWSSVTNGAGNYIINVPVGVYTLRTNAAGTKYVDQFFDNATVLGLAKPVVVKSDVNANANFRLRNESVIKGLVTDENGKGIPGVKVDLFNFDTDVWINSSFTDSNGLYSVNLFIGSYRINYMAPNGSDFIDMDVATPIEVTEKGELAISNIILSKGRGVIKGKITDINNIPLDGIEVNAFRSGSNGNTGFEKANLAGFNFTDKEGNYSISLPPGNYRLSAAHTDNKAKYLLEYYDNRGFFSFADVINISSGKEESADFVLEQGVCINGRVLVDNGLTAAVGIKVRAFRSDNGQLAGSGSTDFNGNYSICLPNGTYRIWAGDSLRFKQSFFNGTGNFEKAKDIILDGEDRSGINFSLTDK